MSSIGYDGRTLVFVHFLLPIHATKVIISMQICIASVRYLFSITEIANNTVKLKYRFSRDDTLLSSKNKAFSFHRFSCEFSRDLLHSLNSERACFCNKCASSNS